MAEFSEEFIRSYAKSADYPRNLLNPSTNHYNLVDYANRLEEYQDDLFSNDDSSSVDIRDLKNWQTGIAERVFSSCSAASAFIEPADSFQAFRTIP